MVQRFSFSVPIRRLSPHGFAEQVQCVEQLFSQTSQNSNYCLKHIYFFALWQKLCTTNVLLPQGTYIKTVCHYVKGLLFSQLHVFVSLGQVNYIVYSMFHLVFQRDSWESVSSLQFMPGQNDTSQSEEERLYLFTCMEMHLMIQEFEGPFAVDQHLKDKRQMVYG